MRRWMTGIALLGLLLALLPGPDFGPRRVEGAGPEGLAEAYLEGNRLYQEGSFPDAARAYEEILARGYSAPDLEYNLGNAYLKGGDLGRAILHYRRALRGDPTHEDALLNLAYARSLTKDVKPDEGVVSRWAWVGRLRLGAAPAAAALFLALCLFLGVASWRRLARQDRAWAHLLQGILGGLVLLAAFAVFFEWSEAVGHAEGVLLAEAVDVRAGPGEGQTVSFRLHEGTEVELLRSASGWIEVKVSDRLQGWVPEAAVARL